MRILCLTDWFVNHIVNRSASSSESRYSYSHSKHKKSKKKHRQKSKSCSRSPDRPSRRDRSPGRKRRSRSPDRSRRSRSFDRGRKSRSTERRRSRSYERSRRSRWGAVLMLVNSGVPWQLSAAFLCHFHSCVCWRAWHGNRATNFR